MTTDLATLATPQRQSRWAVAFLILRILRNIGIAQVVIAALFLARLPVAALIVLVPFFALVLGGLGVLAWWRFTFVVADGELRVTKGIIAEDRLTVPLDRVQSVSLEQGFIHRLIGIVGVSLETAGTAEAEFTIDGVDRGVAEALQRATSEHRSLVREAGGEQPALPPPALTVLRRTPGRLVQAGLARPSFAGLAVLAPLVAVAEDLATVVPVEVPGLDEPELTAGVLWWIPVGVAIAIAAGLLLNLIQIVLSDWSLTLTHHDGGFQRTAGLISRTSRSTNIDRVQALSWRRNPVESRLGIRRVELPTIGEGDLSLPGTDDDELTRIRGLVLGSAGLDQLTRRVSPAAVFRATRNATVVAVLAAAALWFLVGGWAALAFVLVPWAWATSRRRVRLFRWDIGADAVARHRQLVTADRREVVLRKLNGVTVHQSWFERSRGLATVVLRTASGSVRIGMIPLDEAAALRDLALLRVETDRRPWM